MLDGITFAECLCLCFNLSLFEAPEWVAHSCLECSHRNSVLLLRDRLLHALFVSKSPSQGIILLTVSLENEEPVDCKEIQYKLNVIKSYVFTTAFTWLTTPFKKER